jgi:membrane protein
MQIIPDWLRGLLTTPSAELNRWQLALQFFVHLCIHGAQQLRRDRAQQMAAALAYRTIFSIVPVMVVAVVIMNWVYGPQAIQEPLGRMFGFLGLDQISLNALSADSVGTVGPPPALEVEPANGALVIADDETLSEALLRLVMKAEGLHMGTIGLVGLAILIYAALSLLVQVESAFNVIYAASSGRSWSRRITQYWTLITLGPLMLIASFNVQSWFMTLIARTAWGGVIVGLAGFLLTVMISWLLLLLAYRTVPNARVHLRPAVIGSMLAALLWESGKYAFTLYAGNLTGYQQVYGSLALLPVFLLWGLRDLG